MRYTSETGSPEPIHEHGSHTKFLTGPTAGHAQRFLTELLKALPFPLHVLPPKCPQYNGCVERANRSARIEFWGRYDGPLGVDPVQSALAGYEFFYNYERPHAALDWKTPNEYLVTLEAA